MGRSKRDKCRGCCKCNKKQRKTVFIDFKFPGGISKGVLIVSDGRGGLCFVPPGLPGQVLVFDPAEDCGMRWDDRISDPD